MSENFTAKDILKKKGYNIKLKFNIEDFAKAIKETFMELEVKDKILIIPKRFVELINPSSCGFVNIIEDGDIMEFDVDKEIGKTDCCAFFAVADDYCDDAVKSLKEQYGFKVKALRNGNYEIMLA